MFIQYTNMTRIQCLNFNESYVQGGVFEFLPEPALLFPYSTMKISNLSTISSIYSAFLSPGLPKMRNQIPSLQSYTVTHIQAGNNYLIVSVHIFGLIELYGTKWREMDSLRLYILKPTCSKSNVTDYLSSYPDWSMTETKTFATKNMNPFPWTLFKMGSIPIYFDISQKMPSTWKLVIKLSRSISCKNWKDRSTSFWKNYLFINYGNDLIRKCTVGLMKSYVAEGAAFVPDSHGRCKGLSRLGDKRGEWMNIATWQAFLSPVWTKLSSRKTPKNNK